MRVNKRLALAMAGLVIVVSGCSGAAPATPTVPSEQTPPPPPVSQPAEPAPAPEPEPPKQPVREMPKQVRGIHFSGWYAGSPDLYGPLLDWAKFAGINTVVLDIKAEDGKISWET
ncbi:MAG TPA: putative glycoside hydrolase, partial [Symbiobacteriaceae bacterium]|nr:putative glycoside hydrolase [Symbiobacteriaceae bacterium]